MADKGSAANGYYIGLMSGTSLDGIDAVVCEVHDNKARLLASHLQPWPESLRQRLEKLIETDSSLQEMLQLDQLCAEQLADAALACLAKTPLKPDDIIAIGSHGQTIRHSPDTSPGYTLQIGQPAVITEITGITTVGDFRSRDIAAGGQGAPFAPAFHQAAFGDEKQRTVVNIGGIANVTILGQNSVSGYDTGPGNRLLDDWFKHSQNLPYDADGAFAASGTPNTSLLQELLKDEYFSRPHPKSTGSDYFNLNWLQQRLNNFPSLSDADIQATLSELTAASITAQIGISNPACSEVLVCGGGWHNTDLIKRIRQRLPGITVESTEKYGISADWMEAMAFAWLAWSTVNGIPGNLPEVTGARGKRICGAIYPR